MKKNQMNPYKFERGFNIRKFIIILSVLFIVFYGLFNARNILIGPTIEIFSPTRQSETDENIVTVKGRAKNIISISLNEKPIYVDTEGLFEEKLLLSPGFNIIEVKARDRFKNEVVKTVTMYYKENSEEELTNN